MATEDKLNMSLDAMIAKSSKSHVNKKAGGRKITAAGKGPGEKAPGSGGKKIGNGAKTRSALGVRVNKGPIQKRTSAPRRFSGPNPNHFLDRDVENEPGEVCPFNSFFKLLIDQVLCICYAPSRPATKYDMSHALSKGSAFL